MNKNAKVVLILGVVAVAGYMLWRWYQARQAAASGQGAVSQLGTNLNSLAPELVGGSSGPSSGPQVTMPVTITLTEPPAAPEPKTDTDTFVSPPTENASPLTQSAVTGAGSAGEVNPDDVGATPEPAGGIAQNGG